MTLRPMPHQPNALSKGKEGKQHDKPQVPELTEVPTRLETVVKLSGSTCYRAMVIQDACRFLSDVGIVATASASRAKPNFAQRRSSDVKAFTRANVGLSRAIGTTIIVSPLCMAGQPGACIVTAVLQAGFAIVDTTAHGEAEIQTALDTEIRSDQDMEACLNGRTFGQFPLPMALCWQRVFCSRDCCLCTKHQSVKELRHAGSKGKTSTEKTTQTQKQNTNQKTTKTKPTATTRHPGETGETGETGTMLIKKLVQLCYERQAFFTREDVFTLPCREHSRVKAGSGKRPSKPNHKTTQKPKTTPKTNPQKKTKTKQTKALEPAFHPGET